MPPYNNIYSVNPQLIDPENGNYRVEPSSPAINYGCQIFDDPINEINYNPEPQISVHRDTIEVGGLISENTNWNADVVVVTDDILVESDAVLSIQPGTEVIFEDYYQMQIQGALLAVGTAEERIVFKSQYEFLFEADSLAVGAWGGIFFNQSNPSLPTSKISFCELKNAKALIPNQGEFNERIGGAIRIYDYSNLIISNNYIHNNLAFYAGAIFCYKNANPIIFGNLITENTALKNVAAIYNGYSYPRVYNNTIVGNYIDNQEEYIETCTIKNFLSKPHFYNNIIRDNEANIPYLHQQIWEAKEFYTRNNNIQNIDFDNANIDQEPIFMNDENWNYQLELSSPCVDSGSEKIDFIPELDLAGNERVIGNIIDMGCFEAEPASADDDVQVSDISIKSCPNPININSKNNNCVKFSLNNSDKSVKIEMLEIYNLKGQLIKSKKIENNNMLNWNLKDKHKQTVNSGIYFYNCKLANKKNIQGKIVVIQ